MIVGGIPFVKSTRRTKLPLHFIIFFKNVIVFVSLPLPKPLSVVFFMRLLWYNAVGYRDPKYALKITAHLITYALNYFSICLFQSRYGYNVIMF